MTIADAVARARAAWPGRGIEVECDRSEQVEEAIAAGADIVMLDNMTPHDAAACVARVRGGPRPTTLIEISGGVTLDTVAAYAATGADVISTSSTSGSTSPPSDPEPDDFPKGSVPKCSCASMSATPRW
jgi:nicotinate-nucleotide pyrophosphorylase (carboxylating)